MGDAMVTVQIARHIMAIVMVGGTTDMDITTDACSEEIKVAAVPTKIW